MVDKKKVDWRIVCFGLGCITALEAYALSMGYNGTGLKIVYVIIAGAIGIIIENPIKIKK